LQRSVLIVDTNRQRAFEMLRPFVEAGHLVRIAWDFFDAKEALATYQPDLLVTAVRLGSHNGLHLVVLGRAERREMVAIVVDAQWDPVLESETRNVGGIYLAGIVDANDIAARAASSWNAPWSTPRRWPRMSVPRGMPATVARNAAQLIDVSYGGLRLELSEDAAVQLPDVLEVALPDLGISVNAHPLWIEASGGRWCCGVEIRETDAQALATWRGVVDSLTPPLH
jgi:hypothetical protein